MLGSGLSGPNGLALDPAGNLYEADWERGTITRITPSGVTSRYASGFKGCAGLAFERSGALLIAAYNGHTLERVPPGGGTPTTFVKSGLNRPVWPAVDSRGRIYLADYSNNRIARISADGQASTFVGMRAVNAIAVDSQDNLWVCTWGGTVAKMTPDGKVTPIASGLPTACGIAWSPNYLAIVTYGAQNRKTGRLLLMDFQGRSHQVATGLDRASSVIFDRQGNLYAANVGDRALRKYALTGARVLAVAPVVPPNTVFHTGPHIVTIGPGGVFTPSHVYVRPGASTRFVNRDTRAHTVTGFGGATSDSGPIPPGGSYTHGWRHPGTWTFHDRLTANAPVFTVTDVPTAR
jgi:sugar lactone lactonase YvrE